MSGWIKIDRKIQDNPVLNEKPFDKFHAWMDLLLMAEYKMRTVFVNNTEVTLLPGQILISQRELSDRWGWSRAKVIRFLEELERTTMCTTNRTTNGTTLTLVNWRKYQTERTTNETTDETTNETTLLNTLTIYTDSKENKKQRNARTRASKFRNYDERHTDYEKLFSEVEQ